jgi:hypothetical protein
MLLMTKAPKRRLNPHGLRKPMAKAPSEASRIKAMIDGMAGRGRWVDVQQGGIPFPALGPCSTSGAFE